jgi:gliding motility-associated-like protein|tara:strand:+ start:7204 stop:9708 length:2505 start_codon:yes stop_codon:yes gene_type:complete
MKTLLIVFTLLISNFGFSQLVINEYSCSNMNGPTDAFGDRSDWVELYNPSGTAIDLTGYFLSDKSSNVMKWAIPSGSVPANGYAMIHYSKRNLVQAGEIHPDFALSQTQGEWIMISDPLANVVDSLKMRFMTKANHSYGRTTNGASTWSLFTTPTPNAANTGGVNYYTPKPVLSIAPGFYTSTQSVSIICSDPTATIRYTLDGSDVTTTSTAYSGPISIAATTVLRAAAFSAELPSFMETNTYFINVNHTIPVVSICNQGVYNLIANGNQSGPDRIGHFEIFEQDKSFIDEGQGNFNKHGNDSWAYAQRGFDFIMRDEMGYNNEVHHQIFPESNREDFQRLILKPAANDNYNFENGAHIRDAFVHTLSIRADLRMDERTWRPCIVYLNGQYWGVYEIREKVDDSDFTEFYFGQNKFNLQYLKTWGGTWMEYGAPNAKPDWDALVAYVNANSMAVPANFNYVDSLLNWRSMVDYFVLNSYIVSQDWLNWNTAWWRGMDPSGNHKKWRYTLWDMDATFGHYVNYTGIPDPTANADPCNVENLPNPGNQGHTTILQKLVDENPIVEQFYITRYIDLVNTYFSCAYMNQLLDSMIAEIQPEMQGQIDRWVPPGSGTYAGWEAAVQTLKDFIDLRCTALQAGLIGCYNLTGPFVTTFDVIPSGAGKIKVNSTWAPTYPWSTSYYGGIVTLLDENANSGYVFDHWESTSGPLDSLITNSENSISITGPGTVKAIFKAVDGSTPPPTGNVKGIHLPTAFSPNGDNKHDVFRIIVGYNVESFNLKIYDRWGRVMLNTVEPKFEWDGTYKGKDVEGGVYVYTLEVNYVGGTSENLSGNITVVR